MAAKSKSVAALAKGPAKNDTLTKQKTLSEEMVVDSDEDDQDSDEDDTDDSVLSAAGAASLAASMLNGSKDQQISKSSSDDDDSEPTSSDEDVSMEDAAQEQANGTGDESDDNEEEDLVPPPSGQRTALKRPDIQAPKVNGVKRKTTSQDLTASNSSDESEKSAAKKVRFNEAESQQTATTPSRNSTAPQHSSLTPLPAQAFTPPPGYRAVNTSSSTTKLPPLKGKTIWHISAPAGVPVSSVTSMTLAAIQAGKTVLTHKDIDYTLTEVAATEQSVFLPGKDGYKAVSQAVKKSFTLRPAFTLPTIPARAAARNAGSLAAGNIATAAVKAIRPQPEGLKMRYKPPGFGKGNPGIIGGESDEREEDQSATASTFQFPRAVGPSTDGGGSRVADGDVRKKKKQKGLKSAPNGLDDDVEPQAAVPAKGSVALDKAAAKVIDGNGDEEARRKAEKKARKAAKKKALAEAV